MKNKILFACFLFLVSLAGQALAAEAPDSVTGIVARVDNGNVIVTWDPVRSTEISYYRVYISSQSILENDGLYDDFEVTNGDEATLSFQPADGAEDVYIAVIAVSTDGLESEFFVEEASVQLSGAEHSESSSISTSSRSSTSLISSVSSRSISNDSGETIRLLRGTSTSPTEMVVEFSKPMIVTPEGAPEGLHIKRPNGSELRIMSITIDGVVIRITTDTQERGVVYSIDFSEPFEGREGEPLDADDRSVLVAGHSTAMEPIELDPQSIVESTDPMDVRGATMIPVPLGNGKYKVTVEWNTDDRPENLYSYVVYQTRDAQTFSEPSLLPPEVRGVQLSGVTPGFYGLYIQTLSMEGTVSRGIFLYATLPAYTPDQALQGNILGSAEYTEDVPEGFAVLEPIGEEVTEEQMEEQVEVTSDDDTADLHPAAAEGSRINWLHVGYLGVGILALVALMVGAWKFCHKPAAPVQTL